MRHPRLLLATLALMLPVGLVALSAPANATVVHHRHHHAVRHQTLSHRVTHAPKHAFAPRPTRQPLAAG